MIGENWLFWTSWVDTFLWCALGNTRYLCVDSLKPWNIVFSRLMNQRSIPFSFLLRFTFYAGLALLVTT